MAMNTNKMREAVKEGRKNNANVIRTLVVRYSIKYKIDVLVYDYNNYYGFKIKTIDNGKVVGGNGNTTFRNMKDAEKYAFLLAYAIDKDLYKIEKEKYSEFENIENMDKAIDNISNINKIIISVNYTIVSTVIKVKDVFRKITSIFHR